MASVSPEVRLSRLKQRKAKLEAEIEEAKRETLKNEPILRIAWNAYCRVTGDRLKFEDLEDFDMDGGMSRAVLSEMCKSIQGSSKQSAEGNSQTPVEPINGNKLNISEASDYLQGVSTQTLYRYRHQNIGPRSYVVGARVFYDVADLDVWIAEQKATSSRGGTA